MVNTTCAVYGCLSSGRSSNVKFHQFPRTEERCKAWIEICNRQDLRAFTVEQLQYTYVCSKHFDKLMYGKKHLKKFAIPTLHLGPWRESVETQTEIGYEHQGKIIVPRKAASPLVHEELIIKQEIHDAEVPVNEQVTIKQEILFEEIEDHPATEEQAIKQEILIEDARSTIPGNYERVDVKIEIPIEYTKEQDNRTGNTNVRTGNTDVRTGDTANKLKRKHEETDMTLEQFLKACDKFLLPSLSEYVKVHAIGKAATTETIVPN